MPEYGPRYEDAHPEYAELSEADRAEVERLTMGVPDFNHFTPCYVDGRDQLPPPSVYDGPTISQGEPDGVEKARKSYEEWEQQQEVIRRFLNEPIEKPDEKAEMYEPMPVVD